LIVEDCNIEVLNYRDEMQDTRRVYLNDFDWDETCELEGVSDAYARNQERVKGQRKRCASETHN
jgi:hypothetical protein